MTHRCPLLLEKRKLGIEKPKIASTRSNNYLMGEMDFPLICIIMTRLAGSVFCEFGIIICKHKK
jgi:hypothetical protein